MPTELRDLLTAYLSGWKTLFDCAEWLASIEWDDPSSDDQSIEVMGRLQLLATEAAEGVRPERELRDFAANEIARLTGTTFALAERLPSIVEADSTNDSTTVTLVTMIEAVQESLSWSRSPRLEFV